MKRIAGLAGVLVTAAGLAVFAASGASADVRGPAVPVGLGHSGVVHGAGHPTEMLVGVAITGA